MGYDYGTYKKQYNIIAEKYKTADVMKEDFDMCTLFDEIAKENKAEGIIETGFDCGLSENDILERLQKRLNISM